MKIEEPDEFQYATSADGNMAIMHALNEIAFWEKMKMLMPLVAAELMKAGVDFSKVDPAYFENVKIPGE